MNKLFFSIIIGLLVLVFGAVLFTFTRNKVVSVSRLPQNQATNAPAATPKPTPMSIVVRASNYEFIPKEIRVKKGQPLRLIINSYSGSHSLVIDGYNLKSKVTSSSTTDALDFIADKTGTFEFYCGESDHREKGMKGTLIVE